MGFVLEEFEVMTIRLNQIAILKHPKGNLNQKEFDEYKKQLASYVVHRKIPRIHIKHTHLWDDRPFPDQNFQMSGSNGKRRDLNTPFREENNLLSAAEQSSSNNRINSSSNIEIAVEESPNSPSIEVELKLDWDSADEQPKESRIGAAEENIDSPIILKLNDFNRYDIRQDTLGANPFEILHTDNVAQLSFRYPLDGPNYLFRKIRLSFQNNAELQDFLCRVDTLIRVRRCRQKESSLALISQKQKLRLDRLNAIPVAQSTRSAKRKR